MGFSSPGVADYISKRNGAVPKMNADEHIKAAKSHGYAASAATEAGDSQAAAYHYEMAAQHHQEVANFLSKKKMSKPIVPNYSQISLVNSIKSKKGQ